MPACGTPAAFSLKKSWSWVTTTRPSARACAACASSVALRRPASGVVVTSMPRRLKPSAIARLQFSSRWKRIVRRIGGPSPGLLLEGTRPQLHLHLLDEPLTFEDVSVNPLAVFVVV